ncbi:MAG: hypothetical protein KJ600_00255 [Nanoarchaeota archaeon]|nr:hypothetical protein [Nanoarchaeota archaeon]MBU1102977.1 hypothetical protein [Nanoarchaeota archaeon]
MKKPLLIAIILFLIPFSLFLLRATSQKQLDDLSPEIPCSENLIEKSDVLWVIPKFNNISIQDKEWCDYILSLNKTLGLHGVYHTYEEFQTPRSQDYLNEGITAFENCFHFKPEIFKPPQLKISKENKQLIKNSGLKLKTQANQLTHKVYHCSDTGKFSNRFIDWF